MIGDHFHRTALFQVLRPDSSYGHRLLEGQAAVDNQLGPASLTLKQPMTIAAIRPKDLKQGGSVKVVADHAEGSIEPLLWAYNCKPEFDRTYYLRTPLTLPAGAKIKTYPPTASLVLTRTVN